MDGHGAPDEQEALCRSFSLNTWGLALILAAVIFGATFAGLWIGRSLRDRGDTAGTPRSLAGVPAGRGGADPGVRVDLAVGRYEAHKAAVVDDANAIGTAAGVDAVDGDRAGCQPAGENPARTHPLQLAAAAQDLYTDTEIVLSDAVPVEPTALIAQRASMELPPAATGPT